MIEASAAPAADDVVTRKPAPLLAGRQSHVYRRPLTLVAGWLVLAIGLSWFVFAGSVRVGAGHWLGQRLRARVIWSRFLDFLADHGFSPPFVGLVGLMAVVTLVGGLALVWWVLGLREGEPESPAAPDSL